MPKFKPQYRRLLFVDGQIRDGKYPNCTSLAKAWEVSSRTIARDMDYLRDELAAPIAYDRKKNGYYYSEANYRLPTISVSESDLFAVCIASKALKQFENTPLHARLRSIFSRLEQSLPQTVDVDPAWLDERILIFSEPATTIDPEIWKAVAAGVRENRRVRIQYKTLGAPRAGTRTVEPYYLVNFKGEWYVTGFCRLRKSIRTFALSRIRKAELLTIGFVFPAEYDPETLFGDRFGITWQESHQLIRIRFTSRLAPFITERQWHPDQRIKKQKDGSIVLEFTTNHMKELKDWVLSWGAGATVIDPKELRDVIRSELQLAASNYNVQDPASV